MTTRREVLVTLASLSPLVLPVHRLTGAARRKRVEHPTPRPGITGAKVLTAAQLGKAKDLAPLFDGIRAIPHIADGIGCYCGCAGQNGHRSLLTCYETDAMARSCPICQGEGRVAVRMAKDGRTLDDIRTAIDAQFG